MTAASGLVLGEHRRFGWEESVFEGVRYSQDESGEPDFVTRGETYRELFRDAVRHIG